MNLQAYACGRQEPKDMAKNKATYHASKAWNWLSSEDFTTEDYYVAAEEATFRKPEGELRKQLISIIAAAKKQPLTREMQPSLLKELLDDFEGFCVRQALHVLKSDDNTAGIDASNLEAAVSFNLRERGRKAPTPNAAEAAEKEEEPEGRDKTTQDDKEVQRGEKSEEPAGEGGARPTLGGGLAGVGLLFQENRIHHEQSCLGKEKPTGVVLNLFEKNRNAWRLLLLMQRTLADILCHYVLDIVSSPLRQEVCVVFTDWQSARREAKTLPMDEYQRVVFAMEIPPWRKVRQAIEGATLVTGRWANMLLKSVFIRRKAGTTPREWLQSVKIAQTNLSQRGFDDDSFAKVWMDIAGEQLNKSELIAASVPAEEKKRHDLGLAGLINSFEDVDGARLDAFTPGQVRMSWDWNRSRSKLTDSNKTKQGPVRKSCGWCGKKNHTSQDCRRRLAGKPKTATTKTKNKPTDGKKPNAGNKDKTCSFCHRKGHEEKDCWIKHPEHKPPRRSERLKKKAQSEGKFDGKCFLCGAVGHRAAKCPLKGVRDTDSVLMLRVDNNEAEASEDSVALPMMSSGTTPRPRRLLRMSVVLALFGGELRRGVALLDTCSVVSLVTQRVAMPPLKDYAYETRPPPQKVTGAHGVGQLGPEGTIQVVSPANFDHCFQIAARLDYSGALPDDVDVLLGLPAIRRLHVDINQRLRLDTARAYDLAEAKLADSSTVPRPAVLIKRGKKGGVVTLRTRSGTNARAHLMGLDESAWLWLPEHREVLPLCDDVSARFEKWTPRKDEADPVSAGPHGRTEDHHCLLGEAACRRYLERQEATPPEEKQKWHATDVDLSAIADPVIRRKFEAVIKKFEDVFATDPDALPQPMVGPPYMIQLVPNAKPVACKKQRFGAAQEAVTAKWTRGALRTTLLEGASDSEWCARTHLVKKAAKGERQDGPNHTVRVTGDWSLTNDEFKRLADNYQDPDRELARAMGWLLYFVADGLNQFWSILLHPDCRDFTTVWTPLGKMRYTRLPMGLKCSSVVAQAAYRRAIRTMPEEDQKHISNFQDDFCGYANDFERLLEIFATFLQMCRDNRITLKASKVSVGVSSATFYGRRVSADGIEPLRKNLDPILKMESPENQTQCRSLLGMAAQLRKYIPDYATTVKPIAKLTGKGVVFEWEEEQQLAFDKLQEALGKRLFLHAPDYELRLHLETDASDDGLGACLYQDVDGEKKILAWYSQAWTQHERAKPVYYREALAMIRALQWCRPYIEAGRQTTYVWTDHQSLIWVKNAQKGAVNAWILESLQDLDYVVKYRPGKDNVLPDALSRYPLLGPRQLSDEGREGFVRHVLGQLPTRYAEARVWWINVGQMTDAVAKLVRGLVGHGKTRIKQSRIDPKGLPVAWDMALLAPKSDKVTKAVAAVARTNRPTAVLIPNDLIHLTYVDEVGVVDKEVEAKVLGAAKHTHVGVGMSWLFLNMEEVKDIVLTATTRSTSRNTALTASSSSNSSSSSRNRRSSSCGSSGSKQSRSSSSNDLRRRKHRGRMAVPASSSADDDDDDGGDLTGKTPLGILEEEVKDIGSVQDWIEEQEPAVAEYPADDVLTRGDGLRLWKPESVKEARVIVPYGRRRALVTKTHQELQHLGAAKVLAALRKQYHWTGMSGDVKAVIDDCAACQLSNATRNVHHGHFRLRQTGGPRETYALDFHGMTESVDGRRVVFAMLDACSRWVRLEAMREREAEKIADVLMRRLVMEDGTPLELRTDHARELQGTVMKRMCGELGIKLTTTMGYNPRGNAQVERFWGFLNRCLRKLTDEEYRRWPDFLPAFAHAWNVGVKEDLGCSPYEIHHGVPPRLAVDALFTERKEGAAEVGSVVTAIAAATQGFLQLARTNDAYAKEREAEKLRQRSKTAPVTFEEGDRVKYYAPPSAQQATKAGRKQKHMYVWRGPAVVKKKISGSAYLLEDERSKQLVSRTAVNLRPYKATGGLPQREPAEEADFENGEIIALLDGDDLRQYDVVRIINDDDPDCLTVRYYGTTNPNLKTARFEVASVVELGKCRGDIVLGDARGKKAASMTGEIARADLDDLVVARHVKLRTTGQLTAQSHKMLAKLREKHVALQRG